MKIIVPMAGRGSRLRPHTLTTPKPLIPIAGKPIVHHLVQDIAKVLNDPIDEIAFIIHESFGKQVEQDLIKIANDLGAKASICYQNQALGTAHAILCAKQALQGPVVVAYADTLFRADFHLDKTADSVIWVKQVQDPSAFGVVQLNKENQIVDFVEKPKDFVSDLAIIGIYYFKNGENLRCELEYLIDNNIIKSGEYQLTDALENMKQKGQIFVPGTVNHWMDCGNKDATVDTNNRMLEFLEQNNENYVSKNIVLQDSTIIAPCYIGDNVVLKNSTIGPNVSLGENTIVQDSTIKNSLIQTNTTIKNANLDNAMIGNHVYYDPTGNDLSIGDYSTLK
ncbi:sugar phosphate nucleotidyltransferase [Myroides sp. LJL119]